MSIVESNQIDGLAQVEKTGDLIVLIVDHLSWIVPQHLRLLEKKIDTALQFVQSGQIYQKYPNEKKRVESGEIKIVFQLVLKYPPTKEADENLKLIYNILKTVGIHFECIVKESIRKDNIENG